MSWIQERLQTWQGVCTAIVAFFAATGALFALIPRLLKLVDAFYEGAKFSLDIKAHMAGMESRLNTRLDRLDEGQINVIQTHHNMLDASPLVWFTADARGHYTWVNQTWSRLTGIESRSAMGRGWELGVHPDDLPRVMYAWQMAIDHQRDYLDTFRLISRIGVEVPIKVLARANRSKDGRVMDYQGHADFEGSCNQWLHPTFLLAAANPSSKVEP